MTEKRYYSMRDQFMFNTVMENKEFLRELLRRVLPKVPMDELNFIIREAEYGKGGVRKRIRIDVCAEDGKRVYLVELQLEMSRFPVKRGRYYLSSVDANLLKQGEDYQDLKDVFLIVITTEDPFSHGLTAYTFRNTCLETKEILDDGRTILYINCRGKNLKEYPELVTFCEYILNDTVGTDEFIQMIDEQVKRNNEDNRWQEERMQWEAELMEERRQGFLEGKKEGLEEGRKEGLEEGRKEGLEEGERKGLKKGKVAERKAGIYTLYQAILGLEEDHVSALECVEQYYPSYSREQILAIINGFESEKDNDH